MSPASPPMSMANSNRDGFEPEMKFPHPTHDSFFYSCWRRQHINGQRDPVHLGIEGDDEGLHQARPAPFPPPFGRHVAIQEL